MARGGGIGRSGRGGRAGEPGGTGEQRAVVLGNGLVLLMERVAGMRSAALNFLVPAGAATDPAGAGGAATVLAEWVLRGAGGRDSRELTSYLDGMGVQRGSSAETVFLRFGASLLGRNLLQVLPVYADMVRRPMLPEDGFGPSVDLAVQQIEAIEDEPAQKLGVVLRERHWDYPWGRPTVGVKRELERLRAAGVRADCGKRFGPRGAILAVAGGLEFEAVEEAVERAFGGWKSGAAAKVQERAAPRGAVHVRQPGQQVQIGVAWDTVEESDPRAVLMHTALQVLSGGMGSRLFTEIREKQGLCYSVQAGYQGLRGRGTIFGYAGTGPERAQQTLEALVRELKKWREGITAEELERAKISMKARIIMQGESSAARAGSLAYDYYHLGRTRSLGELRGEIEGVSLAGVNGFLAEQEMGELTVVTMGPGKLKTRGRGV